MQTALRPPRETNGTSSYTRVYIYFIISIVLKHTGRSILQTCKTSTRETWLQATAIGMFLVSSPLLAGFIYVYRPGFSLMKNKCDGTG